jgi:5'-3' exonuclease
MASAAAKAALDDRVEQVLLCTPDKDLAQCVAGTRVVQLDRMRGILRDEEGVTAKWGVGPESIPDYLAAVGDSADGFPGLPGWGPKSASLVLARFSHFEGVPKDWRAWPQGIRGAQRLAAVLFEQWEDALLFRTLATLRRDVPVFESVDELRWNGPAAGFEKFCERIGAQALYPRAMKAAGAA